MSNFKYAVSAIVGVSLLFLVGCEAVSDTQQQYVHAGVYDSDARVAVTSEQNAELANTEYGISNIMGGHIFEAVKNLFSQYPSLFSLGDNRNSGELYSVELSPEYGHIWFDNMGNQIERPSFVATGNVIAFSFAMYGLEGEHMPIIRILHVPLNHGGGWMTLYRYVDGKYRSVVTSTYGTGNETLLTLPTVTQFYTDSLNCTLMSYADDARGWYGYYKIDFNREIMYIEPIIEFIRPYFYNSSTGERIGNLDDYANHHIEQNSLTNRVLFGMPDIAVVPILRLTELETEIVSLLRMYHGLEYDSDAEVAVTSEQNAELTNTEYTINTNADNRDYHVWTIEELGDIIVASGVFWRDWWDATGRFSYQNTGPWYDKINGIYLALLPSSGFGSLSDIRSYLMKYYSEAWVDSMLSAQFAPFIEYNDRLFIHSARNSSSRPNWEAATHTLICQVDYLISVESIVSYWAPETEYAFELTHGFTFIDGRIDSTSIRTIWGD